jgi:hypothetical protein
MAAFDGGFRRTAKFQVSVLLPFAPGEDEFTS